MKKLILASQSPRRKELLLQVGYEFSTIVLNTDESYPDHLPLAQIGEYLARKKAKNLQARLNNEEVAITADTTVIAGNKMLEKAGSLQEAKYFLHQLSGQKHQVITGVCVLDKEKLLSFSSNTTVYFKKLDKKIIDYYVDKFHPLDKAGAYGIQEWIGLVGIEKIEGSYHNVVGLPVSELFDVLEEFNVSPNID